MQDDREDKAGVQDADNCLCRLKDIVKWYPPDRLVLDQFSLEIGRGERVMIRGNAGSGRTTLIRILDQKIKPNEGTLLCSGSIAAIYETTGILESMTLREQIALPLLCQGYSRREAMAHASKWLKKIGEEIREYHKEDRITAYDRVLIAVGQAVLQNPDLIAADTFMTDLNRAEQARILKILDDASKDRACLLMTDEIFCGFPCDRILELRKPMDRQPADNMSWT